MLVTHLFWQMLAVNCLMQKFLIKVKLRVDYYKMCISIKLRHQKKSQNKFRWIVN